MRSLLYINKSVLLGVQFASIITRSKFSGPERERLGERATALGDYLRNRLTEALSGYEMVQDVRGAGLLSGTQFIAPRKLALRVPARPW